jgi:hypothetical protein
LENDRKALKSILDEQIKAKESQKLKEKQWDSHHHTFLQQQSNLAFKSEERQKHLQKLKQRELKLFYDSQLEDKLKQDLSFYLLSPFERQFNKHSYFAS